VGLLIPVGVAHGLAAHTAATMIYLVDNYYDGNDEFGVRWDDPTLGIDWGIANPVVSARDQSNPLFKAIPSEDMPG
jgi:dTDP-4-dehydrorhamnose 3,5-epimerase